MERTRSAGDRPSLVDANRLLLAAIETPPDSGIERRLDRIADRVWTLAHEGRPDPGACCRLREKLRRVERQASGRRARRVARARWALEAHCRTLEDV